MATSGSNYVNWAGTWFRTIIEWSASAPNVANNTTAVTARMYIQSTGTGRYTSASATKYGRITIDGTNYDFSFNATVGVGEKKHIGTATKTITHNSDGAKSITIGGYADVNLNIYGYGQVNRTTVGNFTATLNTIPRASSIGTVSGNQIGSRITVNIDRKSSAFTHQVWYRLPGQSWQNQGTGFTTSASFTIPIGQSSFIPNATSGVCEIAVQTMSGSTKIGDELRRNHTVYVPGTVVPTLSSISAVETIPRVLALGSGVYIAGISRPKFSYSGASGTYGSTIRSYSLTFAGQTLGGANPTANVTNTTGNIVATGTITDSRGRTASRTVTLNMRAYSGLSVVANSAKCFRANSNGSANDEGTWVKSEVRVTAPAITVGGTNVNTITVHVYSKSRGTSSWGSAKYNTSGLESLTMNHVLSGYGIDNAYDFKFEIADKLSNQAINFVIASGEVSLQIFKDGISVGKLASTNGRNLYVGEKGVHSEGPILDKNGQDLTYDNLPSKGANSKTFHRGDVISSNNIVVDIIAGSHIDIVVSRDNATVLVSGSAVMRTTQQVSYLRMTLNGQRIMGTDGSTNSTTYERVNTAGIITGLSKGTHTIALAIATQNTATTGYIRNYTAMTIQAWEV